MAKVSLGDLDRQFVATTETFELYIGENHKGEDIVFTIGRIGGVEHERVSRQLGKQLERSRRNKDRQRKLLIEIMAKSLVLDWVGLIDDDGKKVPCTLENKKQVLEDYTEIFALVADAAGDTGNFRDEEAEAETEKN